MYDAVFVKKNEGKYFSEKNGENGALEGGNRNLIWNPKRHGGHWKQAPVLLKGVKARLIWA
jgi:hypothetical protein